MASSSRGVRQPHGRNFQPRNIPPFQVRPRVHGRRGVPFSSDFVFEKGGFQNSNPSQNTPKFVRPNAKSAIKKPAHICVGFEASQRFPNAKEKLHNVLQGAMKGHSLTFNCQVVNGQFWEATVEIPWPRKMTFYAEGPTRKEAEKNAAAIACVELERIGVANISLAGVMKKEAVQSIDEPKWIYIDDNRLSLVESFLLKNSVLSQQLHRNQLHPVSQVLIKAVRASGGGVHNQSTSQMSSDNSVPLENTDTKYWKDVDVEDFSTWDIHVSHAINVSSSNDSSSLATKSTGCTPVVNDIFTGLSWKELTEENHIKLSEQLLQGYKQRQEMLESRMSWHTEPKYKLPVSDHREKIVNLIEENKVVVLSGETGCGKTTQIPQYIFDHAIKNGKGSHCNIVVTQPRRIVAMSIAERVAWERGEVLAKSIGYQVRLEGTPPTQWGRILFCTTGILLRRMQNNTLLQGVSHVIVDEVHERDINTDFLLILLKMLLNKSQEIKVVVMSATVNSEKFSQYFDGCPSLTIPGVMHSVTEYFLPDIYRLLDGTPTRMPAPPQSKRFKPSNHFAKVQRDMLYPEADVELVCETILHVCRNYAEMACLEMEEALSATCLLIWLSNLIIHPLLRWLGLNYSDINNGAHGAILCFLAGWDEITLVNDTLSSKIHTTEKSQFLILSLHSMLPMFNQKAVFERSPIGVRKIVLATNIAETSITIDDVVYVINAGNAKEKRYDAANKVPCLTTHWISQASVIQRRGRAGRSKAGFCFNLFTKDQFQKMARYQMAEMQRSSLEEIVLQTKVQCPDHSCKVKDFLSQALDPPSPFAVQSAILELQEIGAMDYQEELTALGRHMAYLPVEPRIGKMIIYGVIFRCLDPLLTIAAGLSYKDPFVTPLNCRQQADQCRKDFAHGSKSDHVALLNAFNGWTEAMSQSRGKGFVDQRFLHWGTLNMIRGMRNQFIRLLESSGLVCKFDSGHTTNSFGGNLELVKAVVCAALFPNAVKVGLGIESKGRCGKKRIRVAFRTKTDGRVFLHPSSVNYDERRFASQWLTYHEKVKSTQVFIRDCSMVHPVALICLCGKDVREIRHETRPGPSQAQQQPGRVTLAVDGDHQMAFHCSPRLARVFHAIRDEISKLVACNISSASSNGSLFHHHNQLIEILSLLLTLPIQESLPNNE